MKPTVGRQVHYWPVSNIGKGPDETQPLAATITYVHDDGKVNLAVFDYDGQPHQRDTTGVPLIHSVHDDRPTACGYCTWPLRSDS